MTDTPFIDEGKRIGELVQEKNKAYGDAVAKSGEILAVLFPDGVPQAKYGEMLFITRVLDKLFRLATNPGAFNENPYADIAGYALLKSVQWQGERPEPEFSDYDSAMALLNGVDIRKAELTVEQAREIAMKLHEYSNRMEAIADAVWERATSG